MTVHKCVGYRTRASRECERTNPTSYCQCWSKRTPMQWKQLNTCSCGEEYDVSEWKWEHPADNGLSWVVISDDQKQVTFHPFYSSGTAAVRGDTPMKLDYHYYWEVKMLTETYGTDIMVGLGSEKVNVSDFQFKFTSLLGLDTESYGLSYTGAVRHNASSSAESPGFCRGTIIGVRVNMWQGTLEFYLNRQAQGISFYNLRRHQELYPIICSTAAQSSMRLIYAASWRASLLVDAAKILAASVDQVKLPPGLFYALRNQFWLTMPNGGYIEQEAKEKDMECEQQKSANLLSEILPSQYMNGFYVDSVDRDYRVVVWE
ncbi:SPRY domain-containing SOCS box protein 3-like isoform X1 [Ostrinia furnacalis]|uniref:SPRY domain-containing SOCS box protein 3-like isoform X1 n=1 Tax=Ostrinia furnacalis TaxID=93504 RepID=UPI00103A3C38|nr:SPRY domain-containing SOCS box protein 3-like isoform X1 [Ostrinia furnacalis]